MRGQCLINRSLRWALSQRILENCNKARDKIIRHHDVQFWISVFGLSGRDMKVTERHEWLFYGEGQLSGPSNILSVAGRLASSG